MLVMKFGGTSMGSPESINSYVVPIIIKAYERAKKGNEPAITVVVSAMTKVTNILLSLHEGALRRKKVDKDILQQLRLRHAEVVETIKDPALRAEGTTFLTEELDALQNFLKAISVLGESNARSFDVVMAFGEKISAKLLSLRLCDEEIKATYTSLEEIITEGKRYNDDSYWDDIEVLIREKLNPILKDSIPVVTGYFGKTANGLLQDVGRGYSDYCATLVGAALHAKEVQIWTDVDGVLTSNPQLCPKAKVLEHISFDEMAELSQFGAKVLHPFSVRPAENKDIPLRILNTFNAEGETTVVTGEESVSAKPFKSIAYKKDITVLRITTPKMLLAHGYIAKLGAVFGKHGTSLDLISTSEVSVSLTCDRIPSVDLLSDLQVLGKVHVTSGSGIISLVGSELENPGIPLARTFKRLEAEKIEVSMVSFGDLKVNISLVVDGDSVEKAVSALHNEFFE